MPARARARASPEKGARSVGVVFSDTREVLEELSLGLLDPRLVGAGLVLGRGLDLVDHPQVFLRQLDGPRLDAHGPERLQDADELVVLVVAHEGMIARRGSRPTSGTSPWCRTAPGPPCSPA